MLYLLLAILSSALVSIVMRLSEGRSRNGMAMLAANYVMCSAAAWVLAGSLLPAGEGTGLTLIIGSVTGVLYLLGFLMLRWNIRRNGLVLPATFQKLGVLVPAIAAVTVFGEALRWTQLTGFVLAIGAILLMQGRADEGGKRSTLGLIALLLCGGLSDVMSKCFESWGNGAHAGQFLTLTFGVALIGCLALCVIRREKAAWADILWGLMLGVPNYMSARFLLWALKDLPAVVVYPSFSVGTIVAVTLTGVLAFREKVEKRKLIALGLILLALVLLNL